MKKYKILILLPNGLGLRNFAYSNFLKHAKNNNLEVIFWNATSFDLSKLELEEFKLKGKPNFKTDLLKRARKIIELNHNIDKFNDPTYQFYNLKSNSKKIKDVLKQLLIWWYVKRYKKNLYGLRKKIKQYEQNTSYFKRCIEQLKKHKPDLVFSPSQRPVINISPVLAAQYLNIPTVSFIFSWDNMPKGLMVLDTDFYFVWSKYMLKETKNYYPHINKNNIKITGTPQFEMHLDSSNQINKLDFFKKYNLDLNKTYLCFSGNDITTSPHDHLYLKDLLKSVENLNTRGHDLGVIFRKNPIDKTNRFENILIDYKHICRPIKPLWIMDEKSQNIIPTIEDQLLLVNIIKHSALIINLGSSMIFDAACHNKPCAYINYNPEVSPLKKDIKTIYKYIHFRSMPQKNAVVWINSKCEFEKKILDGLYNPKKYVENAKEWFKLINAHPIKNASERIVNELIEILKMNKKIKNEF